MNRQYRLNAILELLTLNRTHGGAIATGGVARPQSYELTGPYAGHVPGEIVLDIAFMGVEGIDSILGTTAAHEDEARVNQQLASRARKGGYKYRDCLKVYHVGLSKPSAPSGGRTHTWRIANSWCMNPILSADLPKFYLDRRTIGMCEFNHRL